VTVAAGGKLTARNSRTERVAAGKCFWISGGNLGGFMGLDTLCKFGIEAGCGEVVWSEVVNVMLEIPVFHPVTYCLGYPNSIF